MQWEKLTKSNEQSYHTDPLLSPTIRMYEIRTEKTFRQNKVNKEVTHMSCIPVISSSTAKLLLKQGWWRGEDELTRTTKVSNNPGPGASAVGSPEES